MRNTTAILKRDNLSSAVVEYIKEMILIGKYREGNHILESVVAKNLGISRAPVREGIRELEKEGIITIIPRRGCFVTEFTVEDIKEVFDIRLLLENDILDMLVQGNCLEEEDFIILENIVRDMVEVAKSSEDDLTKALIINKKDMEFHKFLWQKSGSKRRVAMLEGIFFQLRVAMLYDTNETGNLLVTATDHYEIIKHLRSSDLGKLKNALREHIVSYKKGIF